MEDINEQDGSGWTQLHTEISCNNYVAAKSLLEKKANPHIYTKAGNTPLTLCTFNTSGKCFRLLLKYETYDTFLHKNKSHLTTLDHVVLGGMYEFAAWILDAGGGHSLSIADIPPWFKNLICIRKNIKRTLIVFHHLGRKNPYLKKDMTDKIVGMIWETRDLAEWLIPEEGPSLKKIKI